MTNLQGDATGSGTGFFFDFGKPGQPMKPAIITNKHVVEGFDRAVGTLTVVKNDKTVSETLELKDIHKWGVPHPDNSVDLFALPVHMLLRGLPAICDDLVHAFVGLGNIPDDKAVAEMDAIEDVLMIGYPQGLIDSVNNTPITRRGITATPYSADYLGLPQFLLDIACFPGSSGSPVYVHQKGIFANKMGTGVSLGGERLLFLGVVKENISAVNNLNIRGDVNLDVKTLDAMNLAICIKARELLAFTDLIPQC